MDHQAIQDQLFALHDGELEGPAQRALEEHLLDCAECRALLAQWKRVAGVLFQALPIETEEPFVQRALERTAPFLLRAARSPCHWLKNRWAALAFGLAILFVVMRAGTLQPSDSIEALLLADGRAPAALQRLLMGEGSGPDEVLGLLMEDAS